MPRYNVVLIAVGTEQKIVLTKEATKENAEYARRQWRNVLGLKHWTIDRRPGLDTMSGPDVVLGLTVERSDA